MKLATLEIYQNPQENCLDPEETFGIGIKILAKFAENRQQFQAELKIEQMHKSPYPKQDSDRLIYC